ncbi:phosphatase phospho-type [Vararia minispora EC-137]|uniref:Phosphatase phospho-type n=1 Tax=Vararia minispora EC-137 TaxID=1314806 RepID=A0ACB8QJE7_9AGAM|nr:phosphatase phospho-type [Vararia minispora EC-137]
MSKQVQKQLVVFDFDWSLADQDTDRWIFEVLAPDLRRKMKNLKDEVQWTDLVAQTLRELHARGSPRGDIEGALRVMPFHPAMVRAIKDLKAATAPETTLFILSNSNAIFISTILEDKKITDLFTEVVTNPAEWDSSGLLKLRRRIDPAGPQHDCKVGCSPNMCKGDELEAFLKRQQTEYDRIIYVGDGSNDFCPILRLRKQDMVLCRAYRGLEKRISKEGERDGLKCQVKYWAGAWEVEETFKSLPSTVDTV